MAFIHPLETPKVTETLAASTLSAEAEISGRMNGSEAPNGKYIVMNEQPWHMLAAKYFALGMKPLEVSRMVEKTPVMIQNLLRTPWFQERISSIMAESNQDIMSLFKADAVNARLVLVELMQNEKTPATVRSNIANSILDRCLGKATQYTESKISVSSEDPVKEAERLEKELQLLQRPSDIAVGQ